MLSKEKNRDYLFDNYKVLLIFCVVLGHFIEPCYENNEFLYVLKWLIVSFHMPAFIFISGYFSKKEIPFSKMIQKLLVPYIIYEVLYYLLYVYIIHKETSLYLLHPKFSLWYILALFMWRVITPFVKKIPYHMVIAVIAGLFIGCSDMSDNFLSLPRAIVFYPFFLAGMYFDRKLVDKIKEKRQLLCATVGAMFSVLYILLFVVQTGYSPKIFYGRYNYMFLEQGILEGMLVRFLCYGIGFGVTFLLLAFIKEEKTRLSYLGERTMAIYLFHGLTYSYIKGTTDLLHQVDQFGESILLLLACAGITMLFSWKPFTIFTNEMASVPVRELGTGLVELLSSNGMKERDIVFGK